MMPMHAFMHSDAYTLLLLERPERQKHRGPVKTGITPTATHPRTESTPRVAQGPPSGRALQTTHHQLQAPACADGLRIGVDHAHAHVQLAWSRAAGPITRACGPPLTIVGKPRAVV